LEICLGIPKIQSWRYCGAATWNLIMAAHIHTHDGLDRMVQGVEGLGSTMRDGAVRLAQRPLLARIGAAVKKVAHSMYAGIVAHREARAYEEIARYDWRLAAEIRAAALRDEQTKA